MALTREQADNIKIDEDTIVGFSGSGGDICTEQLARWAYRRLEKWTDLRNACKAIIVFCEEKERLETDGICPTKAYELAKIALD